MKRAFSLLSFSQDLQLYRHHVDQVRDEEQQGKGFEFSYSPTLDLGESSQWRNPAMGLPNGNFD